jgi:hypothetical protein
MKLTNAYQAILAKLGGNDDVNIPAPRNKYEKLLNDISENGGSSGGGVVSLWLTREYPDGGDMQYVITGGTFEEAYTAWLNGGTVILNDVYPDDHGADILPLTDALWGGDGETHPHDATAIPLALRFSRDHSDENDNYELGADGTIGGEEGGEHWSSPVIYR